MVSYDYSITYNTLEVVILISSEVIRGFIDSIILQVLMAQDNYGYQISQEIEIKTMGSYVIKEATLYASFKRLETKGLIKGYMGEITHGGKRKYFSITELGKAYLIEKMIEWDKTKEIIDLFLKREVTQ